MGCGGSYPHYRSSVRPSENWQAERTKRKSDFSLSFVSIFLIRARVCCNATFSPLQDFVRIGSLSSPSSSSSLAARLICSFDAVRGTERSIKEGKSFRFSSFLLLLHTGKGSKKWEQRSHISRAKYVKNRAIRGRSSRERERGKNQRFPFSFPHLSATFFLSFLAVME